MYEARIERDSITQYGERLTTVVVTLPRIVLAELNTHRDKSRSSASSRAIPVEKMIAKVKNDQFFPVYWGKNQKGMQADQELSAEEIERARAVWVRDAESSVEHAQELLDIGVHKQITNRLLETHLWHTVIMTATEWSNWDHLRVDREAQPEIREAAEMILALRTASRPKLLLKDDWHLPFIQDEELEALTRDEEYSASDIIRISVGRSARVSYENHDGKRDLDDDLALAARILKSGHMAPWEHVARPMTTYERELFGRPHLVAKPSIDLTASDEAAWMERGKVFPLGNLNGWVQARKLIHGEWDIKAFQK